jgi:Leucine-rich repeat (LRR) protein
MRKCFWLFLLVFLFILSAKGMPARADDLQMVSVTSNGQALSTAPVPPGSPLPVVSPGPTTISITFNQPIWITAYPQTYMNAFVVSGQYDYGFFISSTENTRVSPTDNKTLVLDNVDLPEDDTITVGLREYIAPDGGSASDAFTFSFTTPAVTNIKMDPVLEQAIKTTLGIPEGREIYQSEDHNPFALMPNPNPYSHSENEPDFVPIPAMDDLTSLTYEYPTSQNNPLPQISSISGLVYADNLQYLNLEGNSIGDLTPLEGLAGNGLAKLQQLYLDNNNISDLAGLTGLPDLQTVDLSSNPLGSTSLAPLTTLPQVNNLALNGCGITDQGLQGLASTSPPSLTYLSLSNNNITDSSPLQGLTGLTYLNLDHNQIKDGSRLSNLTNLTELDLASNRQGEDDGNGGLSDLGFISNMNNLQTLDLSVNNIVYLQPPQSAQSPFAKLGNLLSLDLSDNYIIDITPLQGLTSLHNLDLSSNCLNDADLKILEGMTFQSGQDIKTSASATITVAAGAAGDQNQPQISIAVTADTSQLDPSSGKGIVTYTYTVTNPNPNDPLSNVNVVDDKVAPVTYVSGDDNGDHVLENGETWTYTSQAYLSETTTDTATVTGYGSGSPGAGATASATITVVASSAGDQDQPQIGITKTANTSSLSTGNGNVAYNYNVINTGSMTLSNVSVTDSQIGPVTDCTDNYGETTLSPYNSWTYTAPADISETTTNIVTVTATIANPPTVNVGWNQDLDPAKYDNNDRLNDDYKSIMMTGPTNKSVSLPELTPNQFGNQVDIDTILPRTTPDIEDPDVASITAIELTYDFENGGQPFDLRRLDLGSYFSKVKIYVNGKYNDALTKSLSFDPATANSTDQDTGDAITTVVLDHGVPFPNASTISVVVPARLEWYRKFTAI